MPGEEDMSADEEIAVAMSIRDLMNAITMLSELPDEILATEHEDIELAHRRLIKLLMRTEQMEVQHG